MGLDETAEIQIRRSPREVAAFMFDPSHDAEWISGVHDTEPLTPLPMHAGSRVRRHARFLGRPIDYITEVVELDPGHRLAMHAIQAPMPMDITYEVERVRGGSRARVSVRGDAGRLFNLSGPLIGMEVRRAIGMDVQTLKRILESEPRSH